MFWWYCCCCCCCCCCYNNNNYYYYYHCCCSIIISRRTQHIYIWLYCVRHVMKDHSNNKRRNPLPHLMDYFLVAATDLLYAPSRNKIVHITAFVTPAVVYRIRRHMAPCEEDLPRSPVLHLLLSIIVVTHHKQSDLRWCFWMLNRFTNSSDWCESITVLYCLFCSIYTHHW